MADVTLHRVRKIYGDGPAAHVAVHGVDLHVRDGELLVLVGPSGCGKSTVLRMIAGLEAISSGDLHIGGVRVNDVAPGDRDIAMVFQSYALYPHMTVYDNLAFALRLAKCSAREVDERVNTAAAAMHIESMLTRYPRQLSGGERQRVALGRALVRQPKVFLFDEPLSNLDARLRVEMRREIARLHRELGTTMIYVTHDQVEAMTLGDRIVVLRDGVIQQADTPPALYRTPATRFVAGFIGSPSMNMVTATVFEEAGRLWLRGAPSWQLPVPEPWDSALRARRGREVVVGIRPEHCRWNAATHDADTTQRLHLSIDHVEHLGNESIAHGHVGDSPFAVRCLASDGAPAIGNVVMLSLDPDHLHCFEPETDQRIPM